MPNCRILFIHYERVYLLKRGKQFAFHVCCKFHLVTCTIVQDNLCQRLDYRPYRRMDHTQSILLHNYAFAPIAVRDI